MKFTFSIEVDSMKELPAAITELNELLSYSNREKTIPDSKKTDVLPYRKRDIPFYEKIDGEVNPVYRRLHRLCIKHNCTFPDLIKNGIVDQNGDPIQIR